MPELPEVETTKTSLEPLIGCQIIQVQVRYPRLRYEIPADLDSLMGFILTAIDRRAKYLILDFYHAKNNCKKSLLIHLGMSGSLQQHKHCSPRKHDHILLDFKDSQGQVLTLHYHDPRRFGMVLWLQNDDYIGKLNTSERFLNHLGPEPLSDDFNDAYLCRHILRTNTLQKPAIKPLTKPIKAVIMDQTVVVGVGNIYATESLFLSQIHPLTPAYLLDDTQLLRLVGNIKKVLAAAIRQGGTSLKDFKVDNGKTGYFQQTLLVYGRQNKPCTICQTPLESTKITGRASVYCPNCQPLV